LMEKRSSIHAPEASLLEMLQRSSI